MPELVPLSGSERTRLPAATPASAPLDESQVITVTVLLRRISEVPTALVEGPDTVTSEQLGERYGADPADARLVADVLGGYGLTVTEYHLASRRLKVSGTLAALSAAFGTTLTSVTSPQPDGSGSVTHRYRSGTLSVPAELSGIITAVLGLDNRPQASPHFRRLSTASAGVAASRADDAAHCPADGASGREPVPVPRQHRRDRADDRDHRARRRLSGGRSDHLLRRTRAGHAVGDGGGR
jgi:Pro-kumamolisin, activation domain